MYNVLIVDDEKYVIKSLELSVSWEQLNLHLSATASTADEALRILQEQTIDIIITDIQMPGLSGLALTEKIHAINPNIQIIIISGFANFSYAQEAMKYGVTGYCLKPLDYEEITGYLRGASSRLQNRLKQADTIIEYLDETDTQHLDLFLQENGLCPDSFYVCTSIALPCLFPQSDTVVTIKLGKCKYAYLSSAPFLMSFDSIIRNATVPGGIGICNNPICSAILKRSINDCYLKSYQYFIAGHATVYRELPQHHYFDYLSKLATYIKGGFVSEIRTIFSQIRSLPFEDNYTIPFAFNLYNLVLSSQYFTSSMDLDTYSLNYDQMIAEYITFDTMLSSLLVSIEEAIIEPFTADNRVSSNFLTIIKYINEHYTQNLSLQNIGDALHMNPNYISQLFKKETNTTYIKYVTNLRIEFAKTLLDSTELSVNEICEKIGFNDYFYFLKSFKKAVGVSPTQYRNNSTGPASVKSQLHGYEHLV